MSLRRFCLVLAAIVVAASGLMTLAPAAQQIGPASDTMLFGTIRRSRSVTVTATITAQPSVSTSASTVRPKTARQTAASATHTTTAPRRRRTERKRTERDSPPGPANPLPRVRDGDSPDRVGAVAAILRDDPVTAERAPAPWRQGARNRGG